MVAVQVSSSEMSRQQQFTSTYIRGCMIHDRMLQIELSKKMSENEWERKLNALVEEYFHANDYRETLQRFQMECKAKKTLPEDDSRTTSRRRHAESSANAISEILVCLERGDRRGFVAAWTTNVPKAIREGDKTALQLELKCQMSFAIFPLKHGKTADSPEFAETSQKFKEYLNQRGSSLLHLEGSSTYLAFLYASDPRTCPDLKSFFSPMWDAELKARMEKFLKSVVRPGGRPQLYHLYMSGINSKRVIEAEEKEILFLDRLQRIQTNYQSLLNVTVELLGALEGSLGGKTMTSGFIEGLVTRVTGHTLQSADIDISRPRTATKFMMASIQAAGIEALKEAALLPSLNYNKIKSDLKVLPERNRVLLLQALRWRLTKSVAGEQRDTVIRSYVEQDLLGCNQQSSHNDTMSSNLRSKAVLVREYTARLYNTVASLHKGRAYLCQYPDLLLLLNEVLVTEKGDSLARRNVLGCMQKLSLSRRLQSIMIEQGTVEWLLSILQDQDSLSEYSLHYAAALMMNLCLRSSGKRRCVSLAGDILKVLLELIEHEDLEIRSYVNGTLYSLLGETTIKEEASAMGMAEILEGLMKSSEPGLASQLEYIVEQLTSDKPTDETLSDDEDEEDEDVEDDPDELDVEDEESLDEGGSELKGEKLLCENYLGILTSSFDVAKSKKKFKSELLPDAPIQRPVTPKLIEKLSAPAILKAHPVPDFRPLTGGARKEARNVRPVSAAAAPSTGIKLKWSESRPSTSSSTRQATGGPKQPLRPSSKGGNVKKSSKGSKESLVSGPSRLSNHALQEVEARGLSATEYTEAFAARPKIPRSPESGPLSGPTFVQERPISTEEPPPGPPKSTSRMKLRFRPTSRQTRNSKDD
ncbi:lisH domain-containing protein ARMC9-like [Oscarella lobularis]|uniref:lisH domain-containing protein ARMC9-like n=1 Tax=Oscarella lobularis TaxID=121494 RepID=UPI003313BF0B